MPLLTKLTSGKIFYDDFTDSALNPIWQASPTDPTRISVNDERAGYLRMKHGDTPLYLLMDMPNRDFVLEIGKDYNPSIFEDTAGIVIYRDNETRIEFIDYYNPDEPSVSYTNMRLVKKGSLFTGYGSKNNGQTWELIASAAAEDMTKIGLVVNYPASANTEHFDVNYVKLFADNRFVVGNLTPGMRVELVDPSTSAVLASVTCGSNSDNVYFDMSNFATPLNADMVIYDSTGTELERTNFPEIWGGDVFWYGLTVEMYMDGNEMTKDTENDLGYMTNGIIEKKITVKNPGSTPLTNVRIKKSSYFNYFGSDWVKVAEDAGGAPLLYGDEVVIGTLNPGEMRDIWVKVTKVYTNTFSSIGNYKFLLEVTN